MNEADMLKEINNILSGSYSELGIVQWWSRARVERHPMKCGPSET
jgi:hypothetical protein